METIFEKLTSEKRTHARLSNFIKIKHGYAFKGEHFSARPTKDVLVTPGNFAIGGGFKADKFKYYSGPVPEDYILNAGDLVVTMTDLSVDADTLGYSALIPKSDDVRFLHNQRVGLIQRINDGVDIGFLYYLMRTRDYQSYVVGGASGSTVKHTSPDRITAFEYNFPSLPMQKKIAKILNSYDEKIENNNSIIKNLEATTQTLFDEWFVKFNFPGHERVGLVESELGEIPKDWQSRKLNEVAEIIMGQSPASTHYNDERKGLPFHQGVTYFGDRYPDDLIYSDSGERKAKTGDILVSVRAPVGRINIANTETIIGRGLSAIRSKNGHQSYLFYLLKNLFHKEDLFGSGSVFPAINKKELESLRVLISTDDLIKCFEKQSQVIDRKISLLSKESALLSATRNQLLTRFLHTL